MSDADILLEYIRDTLKEMIETDCSVGFAAKKVVNRGCTWERRYFRLLVEEKIDTVLMRLLKCRQYRRLPLSVRRPVLEKLLEKV